MKTESPQRKNPIKSKCRTLAAMLATREKGMKMGKYKLTIRNNTYVSLYYGEQFIHCYDNCTEYGEEIMAEIEKEQG